MHLNGYKTEFGNFLGCDRITKLYRDFESCLLYEGSQPIVNWWNILFKTIIWSRIGIGEHTLDYCNFYFRF